MGMRKSEKGGSNVEIAEKTYTVEKRADWRNHRSKLACLCK